MADCPYARCIQERKHIRRELLRWTKNMVYVVGLERVAEELMGRRKWKQYQDTSLYTPTRNDNNNAAAAVTTESSPTSQQQQLQLQLQQLAQQVQQQQQQQQAKPGESPLKAAALSNHLGTNQASALTNCGSSGPVGAVGGERSPQRADEQNLGTTGGPENGEQRLVAVAANGATENGPTNNHQAPAAPPVDENHRSEEQLDGPTDNNHHAEEESEALRLKKELLQERIRLSPEPPSDDRGTNERQDETPAAPTTTNTTTTATPLVQGLLRVKREEELQDPGGCPRPTSTPNLAAAHNNNNSVVTNNNGPTSERSASTPPAKKEPGAVFCVPSYVLGRRPSPPPEDWKPLDKCYFCLDGKLQTDEQQPPAHDEQPPLSPQSDNSSQSSRSAESPMSVQVDPMASVVAAALGGAYPTLLPQWCLPPREPSHVAAVVAAAAAAAAQHQQQQQQQQQHQENSGADQPLDLSAKPKNSQDNNVSILEQQKLPLRIDPKTIFNSTCYRAKPRVTGAVTAASGASAVPGSGGGRRTYTEDELQAALRDIQSGKLGTRRAAVLYGIPRSTLRNKVYKLAMERERDANLSANAAAAAAAAVANAVAGGASNANSDGAPGAGVVAAGNANNANSTITTTTTTTTITTTTTPNTTTIKNANILLVDEVDDKELSGAEEEKEVEKALQKPLISIEDLVRISSLEGSGAAGDSLRALLQRGQDANSAEWSAFEHANIGPYIQKMLAAATPFNKGRIGFGGMETQDYRVPEVMRRLMTEDKKLTKEVNVNGDQVQHTTHHLSQQHRFPQSQPNQRAPMTNDDFNPAIEEEASDSGQGRAILKIPSYKPASGTPGPSKNGQVEGFPPGSFARAANASPGLLERASPAFSGTSSPTNSLVGKGMAVNFRDVIAKSICVKFQEGQNPTGIPGQGVPTSPMIVESNPYKRGRFTPPQQQQQPGQTQQAKSQAQAQDKQQQNKAAAGGKGTRPKRGKYRNYDRDSLVEAVRAVQRGEMSVHRAGSYYGVPHSTLEYKVKERHLMRPRKRDQKQADEKNKETSVVGSTPIRTTPTQAATTPDKKAPMLKPQKAGFVPGTNATGGTTTAAAGAGMPGPNGIKVPPFIDGMTHLPFAHPFNFWSPGFMPPGFIPGGPGNVPAALLSEQYFASQQQRMRGLQEHQRNAIAQQQRDGATTAEQPGTSNPRGTPLIKSENLYADGAAAGANGSFLDNLIRSSLESGIPRERAIAEARSQQPQPENLGGSKVLIDQLCRNSRRTPLPRAMQQDSSEDEATNYSVNQQSQRPDRVPTVELSPLPRVVPGSVDDGSDRASPLSLSRHSGSGKEDDATSRSSREREVPNGGGSEKPDDRQDSTTTKKLNHYPDTKSLYAVSTDKKSACDSKLIVDHSSQKTQQQQQQAKDFALAAGGVVIQLTKTGNGRADSPNSVGGSATGGSSSPNSSGPASPGAPSGGPLQIKAGLAEVLQEPTCD